MALNRRLELAFLLIGDVARIVGRVHQFAAMDRYHLEVLQPQLRKGLGWRWRLGRLFLEVGHAVAPARFFFARTLGSSACGNSSFFPNHCSRSTMHSMYGKKDFRCS